MNNPVDAFTKNKFVEKCMSFIPDDPLTQSQYMYYLTLIVFIGLGGYALVSWYTFFITLQLKALFSGLFMTAISLLSLFGLKQTRNMYLITREAYTNNKKQEPIESLDEMKKLFEDNNNG